MRMPDDIELSFQFRELSRRIGAGNAWIVLGTLFSHLASQVKFHGRAGIYEGKWFHHYLTAVEKAGVQSVGLSEILVESSVISVAGDDFYCQLFASYNAEMDATYVPD